MPITVFNRIDNIPDGNLFIFEKNVYIVTNMETLFTDKKRCVNIVTGEFKNFSKKTVVEQIWG